MSKVRNEDFIDNTVITVSGLIIVGGIILIGQSPPKSDLLKYMTTLSLLSLALSFLLALWYKQRHPLRQQYFNQRVEHLKTTMVQDIGNLLARVIAPLGSEIVVSRLGPDRLKNDDAVKAEISSFVDSFLASQRDLVERLAAGYNQDFVSLQAQAFNAPLQEKLRRTKYVLDILAYKARLWFFVVGFMLLVAAIITQLFTGTVA